jgi:hypothetical protein
MLLLPLPFTSPIHFLLSLNRRTRWSSTWSMGTPGVLEDILGCKRKQLTSIKTKHRNRMNLEPALILALTKIRPRSEVLACQKQAQSSHQQVRSTLIIDKNRMQNFALLKYHCSFINFNMILIFNTLFWM